MDHRWHSRRGRQSAAANESTRARMILDVASDLVYETDAFGKIRWVSPSVGRVTGWAESDLLGTDSWDLIHPDDLPSVLHRRSRADAGDVVGDHVTRLKTAAGAYRSMTIRIRSLFNADGAVTGRFVSALDVQDLVVVRNALATLSAGNRVLVRASSEDGLVQRMCDTVVLSGGYRFAVYARPVDDAEESVELISRAGDHKGYLDRLHVTWGTDATAGGPVGQAIRTGQTQVTVDSNSDPWMKPWREAAETADFGTIIALPVCVNGRLDGVLTVYGRNAGDFDPGARELLEELAAEVGYGLDRIRIGARLDHALVSSVQMLAATVEARDPYTAGHQSKVASLAASIGQMIGLDQDRLVGLRLGASLHDLGKIGVPLELLTKQGELTTAELKQLHGHATIGAEIAGRFPWDWPIAEMIHQHHERLDGSGYPRGLRGDEILLEARVIAVADVYDAVRQDRPYRTGLGESRALEILVEGKGTKFDPQAVEALVEAVAAAKSLHETLHA